MDAVYAIGRMLLPIVFIVAGVSKFVSIAGLTQFLTAKAIPQPLAVAYAVAAVEIVAGVMVLVGYKTRWAALALVVFTALAIFFAHDFWNMAGAEAIAQRGQALKNLAIMGGLLLVIVHGPGRYSVDGRAG